MSDSLSGNVTAPCLPLWRYIDPPNRAAPSDIMLQFRIAVPLDDHSLPRAFMSEDEAALLFTESGISTSLQAAAASPFRMSLQNKM